MARRTSDSGLLQPPPGPTVSPGKPSPGVGSTWASQSRCCCGVTEGEQELGSQGEPGKAGEEETRKRKQHV